MILYNYSNYLHNKTSISFEEAEALYSSLIHQIESKSHDADLIDLWNELIETSIAYGKMRAGWLLLTNEEKADKDKTRTALHDSVIANCNILARYMQQRGMDILWREKLGDDRKRLGDFACYITCIYGLNAR